MRIMSQTKKNQERTSLSVPCLGILLLPIQQNLVSKTNFKYLSNISKTENKTFNNEYLKLYAYIRILTKML